MWSMFLVFCIVGVPCGEVRVQVSYETRDVCQEDMVEKLAVAHMALDYSMGKNGIDHETPHRVGGKCQETKL